MTPALELDRVDEAVRAARAQRVRDFLHLELRRGPRLISRLQRRAVRRGIGLIELQLGALLLGLVTLGEGAARAWSLPLNDMKGNER